MTYPTPTRPGYYWAKLKTVSGGTLYNEHRKHPIHLKPESGWASVDWEIVEVWDNNGEGDEKFGVNVFGVPVTQWVPDFYWGPRVTDSSPPSLTVISFGG